MTFVTCLFFALLLAGVARLSSTQPDEQLQGKMETRDGSMCVWFELRKSGRGNVFVTACHCKDAEGHRHSYSCEFDGPMQECQDYQSSPQEFYNMVATTLQSIINLRLATSILVQPWLCHIGLSTPWVWPENGNIICCLSRQQQDHFRGNH